MISDNQQKILVAAYERKFLSFEDILNLLWGFEPQEWGSRKTSVGESQYRAAYSSLSRSLDRLWRRGLVKIWKNITGRGTGITLTSAGKNLARSILADAENDL
jgi:hypothetical protein